MELFDENKIVVIQKNMVLSLPMEHLTSAISLVNYGMGDDSVILVGSLKFPGFLSTLAGLFREMKNSSSEEALFAYGDNCSMVNANNVTFLMMKKHIFRRFCQIATEMRLEISNDPDSTMHVVEAVKESCGADISSFSFYGAAPSSDVDMEMTMELLEREVKMVHEMMGIKDDLDTERDE